jgi:lipoate-protein ligase A
VIEYLNSLGVQAEFSGRNDIVVDGKKISGNAQTVFGDRVMHHGTLLFDTDLSVLEKALNPNKLKMESKGIKSVRARVTDIKSHLKCAMTIEEFKNGLKEKFLKNAKEYTFSDQDLNKIHKLVSEKYSNFAWNIGSSPKGKNVFEKKFSFGVFTFTFDTVNGKLENADITGDFFLKKDILEFVKKLNGIDFTRLDMEKAFETIDEYIVGAKGSEIINQMF